MMQLWYHKPELVLTTLTSRGVALSSSGRQVQWEKEVRKGASDLLLLLQMGVQPSLSRPVPC